MNEKSAGPSGTVFFTTEIEPCWVLVYVHTIVSPASNPIVATPVGISTVVSPPPPVHTRFVNENPAAFADVSVTT